MTAEQYMQLALEEAVKALKKQEVPIGAVVVSPSGHISYGHNSPVSSHDPRAHAEAIAIGHMARHLGNYRLMDCTLYVTLQPCLMCTGLINHARIKTVYYGTSESKYKIPYDTLKNFELHGPILEQACRGILQDFFKQRRHMARKPL